VTCLHTNSPLYNLNYAQTTLWVQSWRENTSGRTRTKKVEYHCSKTQSINFDVLTVFFTSPWRWHRAVPRRQKRLLHTYSGTISALENKDIFSKNIPARSFLHYVCPNRWQPSLNLHCRGTISVLSLCQQQPCNSDGDKYRNMNTAEGKGTRPRRGQCRNTCLTVRSV
jgi:hypothetical protein